MLQCSALAGVWHGEASCAQDSRAGAPFVHTIQTRRHQTQIYALWLASCCMHPLSPVPDALSTHGQSLWTARFSGSNRWHIHGIFRQRNIITPLCSRPQLAQSIPFISEMLTPGKNIHAHHAAPGSNDFCTCAYVAFSVH